MTTDAFVFIATDHQKLAEKTLRQSADAHREIEKQRVVLVGFFNRMIRPDRKRAAAIVCEYKIEPTSFEPGVSIDEDQAFTARRQRTLMAGPCLATPTLGQWLRGDHTRTVRTCNFRRAIR